MNANKPKVSVIVPCYNAAKFLDRCMESLDKTTYEHKEVIFVNDGSRDETQSVLDGYKERFTYVKVLHKENGGVSSARNAGMELASGDYIMFVDPDDSVEPDYLSVPVAEIEKSGCDLLLFGFNCDWTGKWESFSPLAHYNFSSNAEILANFFPRLFGLTLEGFHKWLGGERLMPDKETAQCWRWVYRRSLITNHRIEFRKVKVGEDLVFNSECLMAAHSMNSIDNCLYNYFPRKDGLMYSNVRGLDSLKNKLDLLHERVRLGETYSRITGRDALPLYAGSCIMSCFELGVILSRGEGYLAYKSYVTQPVVRRCVSLSKIHLKNKKALIPHLLLKMGAYRLLYFLFWSVNKLKLQVSY